MTCEEVERLAGAYADGELALETALALETHVEQCAACTAHLQRLQAVTRAFRQAPYFRAPVALALRVRASVATATVSPDPGQRAVARTPVRWRPWILSAASVAALVIVVSGVVHRRTTTADAATTEAVLEGHVRSLMADHLTDVASTDQHTVKPWFAGRVDFSPTVVDLVNEGFPLVGGRLDYIDHHQAAVLVYKRREHAINVFVWPQTSGSSSHVTRSDARGYHVTSWVRRGVAVWVVSDLAVSELDEFARLLDAAMAD
jgi:anti-sigma factor RsiW